ncbi:MAG: alpha/beta hydrolase, partial [bacterium]
MLRGTVAGGVALVVAIALVVLSAMVLVPPFNMAMYPVVIAATEMSPILVLLDLIWCLAANRMLRGYPVLRPVVMVFLIVAAIVAIRPLTQFTRVAAIASSQLGTEQAAPQFSILTVFRGLPASSDVDVRPIHYAATDGAPLTMRLFALGAHTIRSTVVVIYGGAWRNGDATQAEDVSRAIASRGYTVAAIDYRHAPAFHYPAHLDDVRRSIALLRDSASGWGIDPRRMAVLGRSAGGHLAELAAFRPGDQALKAVVALYSPYDLVEGYRDVPSPDPIGVRSVLRDFIGGAPEDHMVQYQAASPATYVRAGLPPTLLLFGGKDHVIKPAFNQRAASDLRRARVPVVAVELPWADHGFDLAPAGLGSQLAFAVIMDFLDREMGE